MTRTEPAFDTRAWRCTGCQQLITHDAPAAKHMRTTAAVDIGVMRCTDCQDVTYWRRTDVTGRRP